MAGASQGYRVFTLESVKKMLHPETKRHRQVKCHCWGEAAGNRKQRGRNEPLSSRRPCSIPIQHPILAAPLPGNQLAKKECSVQSPRGIKQHTEGWAWGWRTTAGQGTHYTFTKKNSSTVRSLTHVWIPNKLNCPKILQMGTKEVAGWVQPEPCSARSFLNGLEEHSKETAVSVRTVLPHEKWVPSKTCAGLLKTISFSNPQARHTPGAWSGCLSNKFWALLWSFWVSTNSRVK